MERNGSHPVAGVAARMCRERHGHVPSFVDVACETCWADAIGADQDVIATEPDMPKVCPQDPNLVDEVVVARACRGEETEVTLAEWRLINKVLVGKGLSRNQIYRRLYRVRVVDALGNQVPHEVARHYPASMVTDMAAVRSRLDGVPVELTPAELRVAIRRLLADKHSIHEVAFRLRISKEQVRVVRASSPRLRSSRKALVGQPPSNTAAGTVPPSHNSASANHELRVKVVA
ncbi:hypothetical protein Snas_0330 [Stackebrandtia nassauensis DSM 44728]|uniref:Uncharacterized protein n=1 Tax=Stackebrandtia nassauensis (strain DSM 44728 / CIP 108903 / NRRL B-16338 / NBRC 102104 / LLR-40K-21) TaxID=446470 RepID=D3Q378_STANL|nr:hypothetical protein Snas_0330 [Stackebrandtia nassauensis DSM 44728]